MYISECGYLQYLQPLPQNANITFRYLHPHNILLNAVIICYLHIK